MPKQIKEKLKTKFKSAEESPGFLLWKAANLLQKSHEVVLKDYGITPAQFSVMTCLVFLNHDHDVTSAMMAKHAGIDKMMISDLVKTFAKKKLITTEQNPQDGRSFFIRPTQTCVEITNKAVKAIEEIDDQFFASEPHLQRFSKSLLNLIMHNSK